MWGANTEHVSYLCDQAHVIWDVTSFICDVTRTHERRGALTQNVFCVSCEWVTSHSNESRPISMSPECVLSLVWMSHDLRANGSCLMWTSHVEYMNEFRTCSASHVNESRRIQRSRVSFEWVQNVFWVLCKWVTSHMDESHWIYEWVQNVFCVACEWVTSHMNESRLIWTSQITCLNEFRTCSASRVNTYTHIYWSIYIHI